jgi:hypothetical protein
MAGWGTDLWGVGPWSGISNPSSSGPVSITRIQYITPTYIRVFFSTYVVLNATYLNKANYSITAHSDSPLTAGGVSVISVLTSPDPETSKIHFVDLITTRHTDGAYYNFNYVFLTTLNGVANSGGGLEAPYAARYSKTMTASKNLAGFYYKDPTGLLQTVLTAISLIDDQIGGSRNDEFDT